MYRYNYELTQFGRAVYTLATGEGDVRERLLIVFQGDLATLTPERLPNKVREDFIWVKNQITKFDEKYDGYNSKFKTEDGSLDYLMHTKIEGTLYRIRNKTGAKIARKIYEIWEKLKEDSQQ